MLEVQRRYLTLAQQMDDAVGSASITRENVRGGLSLARRR
jgi:hypothetical protein